MSGKFSTVKEVSSFRKIAAAMWKHPRDPTIYGSLDIEASAALAFIEAFREEHGLKLTISHLVARAVALAMKRGQRLQVLSSYSDEPGTLVVDEDEIVEQELVSGIAYSRDEAKITLVQVMDKPGVAAAIFGPLANANINVDMIVQNVSADGANTDLTFTVTEKDLERTVKTLEDSREAVGYSELLFDSNVVKVSVIGVGMRSHTGVAQRMFTTLAEKGINIQVISTSEIKVSVLVAEEYTELALRALHTAYGLDIE